MNVKTLERAIRAKCLDCCGGIRAEVRDCKLDYCPLWPYRGAGAEVVEGTTSSGAARHLPLKGKAFGDGGGRSGDRPYGDSELEGQLEIGEMLREAMA